MHFQSLLTLKWLLHGTAVCHEWIWYNSFSQRRLEHEDFVKSKGNPSPPPKHLCFPIKRCSRLNSTGIEMAGCFSVKCLPPPSSLGPTTSLTSVVPFTSTQSSGALLTSLVETPNSSGIGWPHCIPWNVSQCVSTFRAICIYIQILFESFSLAPC